MLVHVVPCHPKSKTDSVGSQGKMQLKRQYDSFAPDQVSSSPHSSQWRTSCMAKMSFPIKSTSISGQAYLLPVVVTAAVVVGLAPAVVVAVVVFSIVVVVGSSVGSGEGSGQYEYL